MTDRRTWCVPLFIVAVACTPAISDTFFVTDVIDQIPAPEGSLRWAIQQSESNGEPDQIVFIVDGGTIDLVAPLPTLSEGRLFIGSGNSSADPPGSFTAGSALFVSGGGNIARALAITSVGNVITELEFIGFSGPEVILITGDAATDNVIAGCVFGDDTGLLPNTGAAIRIAPSALLPDTPSSNAIVRSRFVGNGSGIVFGGNAPPGVDGSVVALNGFGVSAAGEPGLGTGVALNASGSGPLAILNNVFSGPGPSAIVLGAGTARSRVFGNQIGLSTSDGAVCAGYANAAVQLDAAGVEVEQNQIRCSGTGIRLASNNALLRSNLIGGQPADANSGDGILLDGATGATIESNLVVGNGGFGLRSVGPAGTPSTENLISCNRIWRNSDGAMSLPGLATAPPSLSSATPTFVEGQVINGAPGWIELFADDAGQARLFHGAMAMGDFEPGFRARIPVIDLHLRKIDGGSQITFNREAPSDHTATNTSQPERETAELSSPLASDSIGLVFDLIRGNPDHLALDPQGGISLGPVTCVQAGLDPDVAISPNVVDSVDPAPGEGSFYISRRRDELQLRPGTYDPALCLRFVGGFAGGRHAESGDCQ